jgi:hypothetical protein
LLDTPWPKAEQRRYQLQDRQILGTFTNLMKLAVRNGAT